MTQTATPSTDASAADDVAGVFEDWVRRFAEMTGAPGADGIGDLFVADAWWRDLLALDWDIASFHGTDEIAAHLRKGGRALFQSVVPVEEVPPHLEASTPVRPWIEGFFAFAAESTTGRGHVRLVQDQDLRWRAWTVVTVVEELRGQERAIADRRRRELVEAHEPGGWVRSRAAGRSFDRDDPDVLVVGGGQTGLTVAAELGLLGVDTLVVERNARVGDSWRNRYDALVLHGPVWSDHLPHMPFPASWPVYPTKDKVADWIEAYASAMDINLWLGSEVESGTFDRDTGRWRISISTPSGNRVLHPRELVMAVSMTGDPLIPDLPGRDTFSGQVFHGSQYRNAEGMAGKAAVVVGASTSGHDISADLHYAGVDVTMVQRSPIYVMGRDTANPLVHGLYSEHGLPTRFADLVALSVPYPLAISTFGPPQTAVIAELDRELLDGLNKADFWTCMGYDGSDGGVYTFSVKPQAPGGFYINVGASELIIDGSIKIKHGGGVVAFTEGGVRLADGEELPADVVILATGYRRPAEVTRKLLGDEVADQCVPLSGLDTKNEWSGWWRRSGHPALWFAAGPSLGTTRNFSRLVALQIAADLSGLSSVDPAGRTPGTADMAGVAG